jgi:hypothetical protein
MGADFTIQIIPAAPGFNALFFQYEGPQEGFSSYKEPILAWGISIEGLGSMAQPVEIHPILLRGQITLNQCDGVEYPDGTIRTQSDHFYCYREWFEYRAYAILNRSKESLKE